MRPRGPRQSRWWMTPDAAVRAMPAKLLLLCLLFSSSWLMVEGDGHVRAAGVLHRGADGQPWPCTSVVAPSVSADWRRKARSRQSRLLQVAPSNDDLGHDDRCRSLPWGCSTRAFWVTRRRWRPRPGRGGALKRERPEPRSRRWSTPSAPCATDQTGQVRQEPHDLVKPPLVLG
jgi:hypothetical protein